MDTETENKMDEKELKSNIVNFCFGRWSDTTKYRWSDVLDFICEHWKLDEEWDGILEDCCQKICKKPLEEQLKIMLYEPKKLEENIVNEYTDAIVNTLEEKLDKDLEKFI